MTKRRRKSKTEAVNQEKGSGAAPNQDSKVPPGSTSRKSNGKKSSGEGDRKAADHPAAPKQPLFPRLPSFSRIMSVVMLILGIVAVGALFYKVMAGFFVPLFLAALLVVIFRPVHEWILHRVGNRKRLGALATTTLILASVLLPVLLTILVAAGQFTASVSQLDTNDIRKAVNRVRDQLSLSLPHAEHFRRLDSLADTFVSSDDPQTPEETAQLISDIEEARTIVRFLQQEVPGPATAEGQKENVEVKLEDFIVALRGRESPSGETDMMLRLNAQERIHSQSVTAAASIRSWMHELLGGSFKSQLRILANPGEQDFANLIRQVVDTLQPRFVKFTSATGGYVLQIGIGLVILVISLYFFLIDGPGMIHTLMRLSPLDNNYERRLLMEFDRTSRAVVLASVLSAFAQGVLAAIAFYFLGLNSVVLLFMLTCVMALVPFLGAASVWLPCAIWLGAVEQRIGAAIFLGLYGALVVSSFDNVIKAYVLHGRSQLHPLFALLSVIGGVKVFGPIGILVGPMVVVFLQTLLEILNHELSDGEDDTIFGHSEEPTAETAAESTAESNPAPAVT